MAFAVYVAFVLLGYLVLATSRPERRASARGDRQL